ncbi:MAG TPA: amino acid--tRNA ligase-related protein, partial [Chitinophagales bacterium]|nr:amino acid--tRNA ligase-related protein [Chitinophagales bacterium]
LNNYGNDKPDLRFGMTFNYITELVKGKGFGVVDSAEAVIAIVAENASEYTRKQLDQLTDFVKKPQIGASGLVYIKYGTDGSLKSSVDKFYSQGDLKRIAEFTKATPGSLILILAGALTKTRKAMSELRLEMGNQLGLRGKDDFKPLWVVDFPLLEWDEDDKRWNAMHHPFTSWHPADEPLLQTDPGKVRANAYDVVINGVELSSGSIRIHNRAKQELMFKMLGLTKEEAEFKFGFILNAFEYGAPPHGGIAFGFDRFCSIVTANLDYIRDFIAFPKNNAGRDVMLNAPSDIDARLKKELGLK